MPNPIRPPAWLQNIKVDPGIDERTGLLVARPITMSDLTMGESRTEDGRIVFEITAQATFPPKESAAILRWIEEAPPA